MKSSNVGRHKSEILTIVLSVNIFHERQLPLMLVSRHNLWRISIFNMRYLVETINLKRGKVRDSTVCVENLENNTSKRFSDWSSHLQIGQTGRLDGTNAPVT